MKTGVATLVIATACSLSMTSAADPERGEKELLARFSFSSVDFGSVDEDYDEYYEEDSAPAPRQRGRRPAGNRRSKAQAGGARKRKTLLELCTPVFGYSAILPRQENDGQPEYLQFRQQVVTAIQRIEKEAPDYGIEEPDAREAAYGLALFMDEQVLGSNWVARVSIPIPGPVNRTG